MSTMSDKASPIPRSQRVISLAMYLSDRGAGGATRSEVESNVEGYEGLSLGDDDVRKMLIRDLDALRDMGIHVYDETGPDGIGRLRFDTQKSYARSIDLDPSDAVRLRLASLAPLGDPSFIYRDELLSAITKLSDVLGPETVPPRPHAAIEARDDREQDAARKIESAIAHRKELRFTYTDAHGNGSKRRVRPGLLFSIGGDWYLLAIDCGKDEEREFRVSRMSHLESAKNLASPDFDPLGMDIREHVGFPFQYGDDDPFEAVFLLPKDTRQQPAYLWDRTSRTEVPGMPGYVLMKAWAHSCAAAASWAVSYAPGIVPVAPQKLRDLYLDALAPKGGGHA